VLEQKEEILSLFETAMERVCAWSERVAAQMSEFAGRDVTMWRKQLANCEEALRQKTSSLTDAEKGQAELRQALVAKEAELAAAWAELVDEWRQGAGTDQLREELTKAQADVKSLRCRNGVLQGDVDELSTTRSKCPMRSRS
jgi:chromosome segregation ATPase